MKPRTPCPASRSATAVTEAKRTAELEELLIDAEADDEQVQQSHPILRRPWLLLLGLILVALNLRPALSSMAPMLSEVSKTLGLSAAQAGLLTTLPVLCLGLFAPLAPVLARRFGAERVVLGILLTLAGGIILRSSFGEIGLFAGSVLAGASIGVIGVLLPGIVKRDFAETGRHHDRRLHHGPVSGRGDGGGCDRAVERAFRQELGVGPRLLGDSGIGRGDVLVAASRSETRRAQRRLPGSRSVA